MPATMKSLGIEEMPFDEQFALVQEIWNHLATKGGTHLTPNQRAELRNRMADDDANPDDGIPWESVKEEALRRIEK